MSLERAINRGGPFAINAMTTGSILFSAANGVISQDNANLFWNDTNNRLGVDTDSPASALHIKAATPGTVGSHPAGQLIIQNPANDVTANVAITAYESDVNGNPDQQLWYLGSVTSSNEDIILVNRRNADIDFGTNGVARMTISADGGLVVGSPTGGSKGIGTINAKAVYDDNTILTDFVFDDDYKQLSIVKMHEFFQEHKRLPTISGRDEWEEDGKFSLGKIVSQLWETVEVQAKYIAELNAKMDAVA